MITLAQNFELDHLSFALVAVAQQAGRVPVAWLWGPDVREQWDDWNKAGNPGIMLVENKNFKGFPDTRICEFLGLPAYPMEHPGLALRTVAPQSPFDLSP